MELEHRHHEAPDVHELLKAAENSLQAQEAKIAKLNQDLVAAQDALKTAQAFSNDFGGVKKYSLVDGNVVVAPEWLEYVKQQLPQ